MVCLSTSNALTSASVFDISGEPKSSDIYVSCTLPSVLEYFWSCGSCGGKVRGTIGLVSRYAIFMGFTVDR